MAATAGLHVRSGNSMGRTREALLDGALVVLEQRGLRAATMSDVARRSGVAKATLYNHFRTRDELWTALLDRELDRTVEQAAAAAGPAGALQAAAERLGSLPAVQALRAQEPDALLPLLALPPGPLLARARAAFDRVLGWPADDPRVDVGLRWLAAQLVAPTDPTTRQAAAAALAAMPAATEPAAPPAPLHPPEETAVRG